ncbi:MAG: PhzF family phenazine biosynthesis protein [Candidatus Thorarchaeota archaeon]
MNRRRSLDVIQVDAFTDIPYGGNPAAVVLGADTLSDDTMQKIAREMNVRETVFVSRSKVADYRFRYMTPSGAIDFSGHPTNAAFHALIAEGLLELVNDVNMFSLETNVGVLQIEIVKNMTTGQHEVQITHETPQFSTTYDPLEFVEALGLSLADIMSPTPVQTVSTGTPMLIIPVSSMRSLERINPDYERVKKLCEENDFLSIQVFTRDTLEETSDAHARHFAPALGVNEDPVSGSGAAATAGYIMKYGLMDPTVPVTSIVIEQGHYVDRPGKIFVEVRGDTKSIEQVKVSGTGVVVLKGVLYI